MLDGSLDVAVAEAVWRRVAGTGDLAHFFAVLMEESGHSLLELPGFAVAVSATGYWQVAARGQFTAVMTTDGEERSVRGRDVITWAEARVPRGVALQLVSEGAESPALARSVNSGIVPAQSLALELADAVPGSAPSDPSEQAVPPEGHPEAPRGLLDDLFADDVAAPETELVGPPSYEPPASSEAPVTLVGAAELQATRGPTPYDIDDRSAASEEVPSVRREADEPAAEEFGELWSEHTVMRPVEQAALRPPEARSPHRPHNAPAGGVAQPQPGEALRDTRNEITRTDGDDSAEQLTEPTAKPDAAAASAAEVLGDHDGKTVIQAQAPFARRAPDPAGSQGEMVLAVLCPEGHANPTSRSSCRRCGDRLTEAPRHVPRPRVGRLRTNEGDIIDLTGPVIVGREPRAARFQGTDIPRLVSIVHPHISASHIEIQVEGWDVLAADLRSTNGTYLRRLGQTPTRLSESAMPLQQGDVLDLGHGVLITLEELG